MATSNETLTAIVEAWNRIDPLALQEPFCVDDFDGPDGFTDPVADYLAIASNSAALLAAELAAARGKLERVRAAWKRVRIDFLTPEQARDVVRAMNEIDDLLK